MVAVLAALHAAAPDGLDVFGPDLGVHYDRTVFETSYPVPDVSVVRADDIDDDEEGLHRVPLLVVEVLSPSTRRTDLLLKKDIYRELGVPSYWLVDPVAHVLTVLALRDGDYVETGRGTRLELTEPFPVTVDLARGGRHGG